MKMSRIERLAAISIFILACGLIGVSVILRSEGFAKRQIAGGDIQVVEPGIVKVMLRGKPTTEGGVEPALVLMAQTGAQCERVSPLVVHTYFSNDVFFIDVGAYALKTDTIAECTGVYQVAEALVSLEEFVQKTKPVDTKIILRNTTNEYRLSKDTFAVYLTPVQTTNAIPEHIEGTTDQTFVLCLSQTDSSLAPVECR